MKHPYDYANLLFAGGAFLFSAIEFAKGIYLLYTNSQKKKALTKISQNLSKLKQIKHFESTYKPAESLIKEYPDANFPDMEYHLNRNNTFIIEHINSINPKDSHARLLAYASAYATMRNQHFIDNLDIFRIATDAYSTFLRYEENFSISYGYGRYIDALRPLVCLEEEYITSKSTSDFTSEEKVVIKIYEEVKKLTPYIDEMELKFLTE